MKKQEKSKVLDTTRKRIIIGINWEQNSSAALMIAGKCNTLKDGVEYSVESIDSGKANEALEIVKKVSNGEL